MGRLLYLDYPYADTAVEDAALVPWAVARATTDELRAWAAGAGPGPGPSPATSPWADVEGVLCDVVAVDRAVLDALPGLRAISAICAGVDGIDAAECARRGIAVRNVPGGTSEDVATHAVALVLAVWRRLPALTAHVAGGGFEWTGAGTIDSIGAQTVGILGFGRIGQAVARRLAPFGCTVLGCSRSGSAAYAELGVEHVADPEELLRRSSILVVTAPLTDATRDLLDERRLRLLPRGAAVVNVGRGGILDTPALARLLAEEHLSGAGLDVFRSEPPGPDELDALLAASPNVVLTPHAAWYAADTEVAIRRLGCAHLIEALARP